MAETYQVVWKRGLNLVVWVENTQAYRTGLMLSTGVGDGLFGGDYYTVDMDALFGSLEAAISKAASPVVGDLVQFSPEYDAEFGNGQVFTVTGTAPGYVLIKQDDASEHWENLENVRHVYKVPDAWKDPCPDCGSLHVTGCRCPENHRTCLECKARWTWKSVKLYSKKDGDYRWQARHSHWRKVKEE